jgi:hypothetical protein
MQRTFSVGDRVRILYRGEHYGDVVTVTHIHTDRAFDGAHGESGTAPVMYGVDIDPKGYYGDVAYEPHELEPYYDGHEKTTWSECAWQPSQLRVC